MHRKLAPDSFLILVNKPKQLLHSRNSFREDYQEALKKLTLFFLSSPVPFKRQDHKNKMGLELVSSCSSDYKTCSEKFLYQ